MATRGRKSSASLEVVSADSAQRLARPAPPVDLTDEQAGEWVAVTERLPAGWFTRETHALLSQYCRHVVTARRVAQLIEAEESGEAVDIETLDRLYKMQEREGRAMSSLATRMRITQQTTYDPKKKKPLEGKKPWE